MSAETLSLIMYITFLFGALTILFVNWLAKRSVFSELNAFIIGLGAVIILTVAAKVFAPC